MTDTNDVKTYRYKFSENVVKSLFEFSKLHQFEKRKDYKESWEAWTKQNDELISTESRRLLIDGYNGDVIDKMYKSARYYFRTKPTAKVEPKKRRKYTACSRDFIDNMDEFITKGYKENKDFKPSEKYSTFCEQNKEDLLKEKNRIKAEDKLEDNEVLDKIKKLFKNRYFQLIKNK